jgi:cytochrome c oxidase accessory protein FixG
MTNTNNSIKDETYRDSIATINKDGKRNWIYAQQPKGKLYNLRSLVSIVYLIVFFALPFIKVNNVPVFLFNVLERKFIFFGVTFWPQDFFIFGIGMLSFIIFIVLFTVVYGRFFCGWACPQTIFMEMVFRKIEYWIEGDAAHQKLLNKSKYDADKIIKKTSKHVVFFLISFIIANTFLAYVIGADALFIIINDPFESHIGGLITLLIFTGIFYAVYAWFREQVCLIVCPYGRLQGVMTDKNSILVAYDYIRGEPREKYKKENNSTSGDCIDCYQCVKVCPTGIDIRNGTQLECTNCTACIDVCDHMMLKTGKPIGLIRYASENGIVNRERLKVTPRIMAYSGVLILLIGFLALLLITRQDIDATVLRTPGMLFQKQENDTISNLYNIKIINKTYDEHPITLKLNKSNGRIKMIGKNIVLSKAAKLESGFFIYLPKNEITGRKTKLLVDVFSGDEKIESIKTTFLGPITIKK